MNKKLRIRNSTAEFLTFASQNEGNSIEVRFEENTLWLTQQLIAELFGTTKQNVSLRGQCGKYNQEVVKPYLLENVKDELLNILSAI